MGSIQENLQKKRSFFPPRSSEDLPISSTQKNTSAVTSSTSCIRKRISSFSATSLRPISSAAESIRRSKSVSSIGEFAGGPLRRWWEWGVGWFLSQKTSFSDDLEMNEEETEILGYQAKGTWRHVLFKIKTQFKKLLGSTADGDYKVKKKITNGGVFRYDSFNYRQNFDDGVKY